MTTSGGRRELAEVRSGLLAWCAEHRPDVVAAGIDELVHPKAGLSNETIIVRCHPNADGSPGPRLVVRLPPLSSSFPDHDFGLQARIQTAAAMAGIPTAGPIVLEEDDRWLGVPFIVMPFVDGQIPGPASLFDPWLTEATEAQRRDAQREMVRVLASIHAVDWAAVGLDELLGNGKGRVQDQLDTWAAYLAWAADGEPLPRIEAILAWCRAHAPADVAPPSLVWGDPRLENLVFDDERHPIAVLDWELATIGPAEMDLGWFLGLERVLWALVQQGPLPGFAPPEEVARDLEEALGRPLQDPAWHEIFGVLRSICINVRQAKISAAAGVSYPLPPGEANPMVAIVEGWIAAHPASAR
ncbi:phosphotransferase family protein [Aquihabitans sp. McL0605]|uniref:phosphotransferase family protein n=1 Tax=Aquihabitans sp. McL0605 TaxID=3415671 RepID=UPI003CE86A79